MTDEGTGVTRPAEKGRSLTGPARVAAVIDRHQIVINAGQDKGVTQNQEFVIYAMGSELFDPETGDSLGLLEVIKGIGRVISVQEKMSILTSITEPVTIDRLPYGSISALFGGGDGRIESKAPDPFSEVVIGDFARRR